MSKKEKIGIITLGCSKNTVDSERLMSQLKLNDFTIVDDPNEADSVIINTCGFIDAAKEESVNTILEAVNLKNHGKLKRVIVSGCLSQRYEIDLRKDIPEVDAFYGSEDYEGILKEFDGDLKYELLGERELTTPKHYAYLKISEGCDNPCSFCAIPLMRGKHVSRKIEDLVFEATQLAKKGVKELIVIGQDTTYYGKDLYGKRNISELLNKLSKIDGIEWIRLLYTYPSQFPEDLIETIAENPKICKYLDMPLQHISDNVLKSMRRRITSRRTRELVHKIKERVPGITMRTTFIVGYPNETEEDFAELLDFVKEIEFDRVGAFNYSIEEDTSGYILGDPITEEEKENRRDQLMNLQKEISYQKNQKLTGRQFKVLIDSADELYFSGRSEKDAPEVDGEILVEVKNSPLEIGEYYTIEIYDCNEYDLFGKLIS